MEYLILRVNTKLPSNVLVNFKVFDRNSGRVDHATGIPWKKEPGGVNLSFPASYLSASKDWRKVRVHVSRKYETRSLDMSPRGISLESLSGQAHGVGTSNQLSTCYLPAFDLFAISCSLFCPWILETTFPSGLP